MKLIYYFIESGICLLIFYAFYALLLRKENSFGHNRVYLLVTPLISLGIPLVTIPFYYYTSNPIPASYLLYALPFQSFAIEGQGESPFHWSRLFLFLYSAGVITILSRFILQLIHVYKLSKSNQPQSTKIEGIQLVKVDHDQSVFSFLNTIFVGKSKYLEDIELDQIVEHEIAHVQQKHSFDSIYFHILSSFLWFNPAIWWYKSALSTTHEYLADHHVINRNDKKGYVNLLIKQIFRESGLSTVNHFGQSETVKRIEMMKLRTYISDKRRFFYIIPVFLLLVALFSFEIKEMNNEIFDPNYSSDNIDITISKANSIQDFLFIEDEKVNAHIGYLKIDIEGLDTELKMLKALEVVKSLRATLENNPVQLDDSTYLEVDEFPEFVGGNSAWQKYLKQNLKNLEYKTAGKVYIEFTVDADGTIINSRVLRGIDPNTDLFIQNIVNSSPAWIPGKLDNKPVRVTMVIPVTIDLSLNK